MGRAMLRNVCSLFSLAGGEPGVPARPDGRDARPSTLPLVIEPELYRHFASRIIRWQRAEGINSLKRPDRRLVERWYAARLLNLDVRRGGDACNSKSYINPFRLREPRVDFVLQPVFGDLSLHGLDVPRIPAAEIATASGKSKPALGAARDHAVGPADRTD